MNARKRLSILLVLIFLPLTALAEGGTLYVAPSYTTHAIGESFEERVLVDTDGTAINAAEAEISFNPKALSVDGISTLGSILSSWAIKPEFSNTDGTIKFTGWAKKNFNGTDGLLITITFKALRNITSNVQLTAGAILAAGEGESNIITSMHSAVYSITPKEVSPRVDAAPEQTLAATSTSSADAVSPLIPDDVPVPRAPEFSSDRETVQVGEHITARGQAAVNEKITIWLQKGEGTPEQNSVSAGSDGSFTFVSDNPAQEGTYRLYAQAEDKSGRPSDHSSVVIISARPTALSASAETAGNFVADMVPYLTMLFAAGLSLGYLYHRHKIATLKYEER